MVNYVLTVLPERRQISFNKNDNLMEVLRRNNAGLESPCGGQGTCGKCKVLIKAGSTNPPDSEELLHLSVNELNRGIRLACCVSLFSNATISFLEETSKKHKILSDGHLPDFQLDPVIRKQTIQLPKPAFENNRSQTELISLALGRIANFSLDNLRFIGKLFRENQEVTAVLAGEQILGFEHRDTSGECFGLAIDIGTTTLVVSLVDLINGIELGTETAINPQTKYGLDVLSRIEHTNNDPDGMNSLHLAVVDCLNDLTERLCKQFQVCSERIYEAAVAANSTMMHLLLGIHPGSIGEAPYITVFSGDGTFLASEIGLKISRFGRIYCLPGVSGYIGADIVAGVMVTRLQENAGNILFMDIGTNGELVLSKGGVMSSCSCAAGPALEGMNISCGMRAAEGAIEEVVINGGQVKLRVIGDGAPVGICGSGIIDAISEIVRVGLVEGTGRLKSREKLGGDGKSLIELLACEGAKRKIVLCPEINGKAEICITQGDIRQVQLAKGALLSGFRALLEHMHLDIMDLDEIIIAGAFGAHLNIDSLIGLGLFPKELASKVSFIGNSAKSGALVCLLSGEFRRGIGNLAQDIQYFELSNHPNYENVFTSSLNF